jgi:hypothetical protein
MLALTRVRERVEAVAARGLPWGQRAIGVGARFRLRCLCADQGCVLNRDPTPNACGGSVGSPLNLSLLEQYL